MNSLDLQQLDPEPAQRTSRPRIRSSASPVQYLWRGGLLSRPATEAEILLKRTPRPKSQVAEAASCLSCKPLLYISSSFALPLSSLSPHTSCCVLLCFRPAGCCSLWYSYLFCTAVVVVCAVSLRPCISCTTPTRMVTRCTPWRSVALLLVLGSSVYCWISKSVSSSLCWRR